MENKIFTIGFDGLNHSGKGTQIKLLTKYLSKQKTPFKVVRGDGTRAGTGTQPYDFPSKWWQENRDYLVDLSSGNMQDKLNLRFQRLCREAFVAEHYLEKRSEKGVMILDRTFVSRFFTMKQYYPDISLDEALYCYNPKNGRKVNPTIPDITFLLTASKKTLLSRLGQEERSERFIRSEHYVSTYFDLFHEIVQELSDQGYNIRQIDAEEPIEEVHKKILGVYRDVR